MYQMIYQRTGKEPKVLETVHSKMKAEEFLDLRETLAKAMDFNIVRENKRLLKIFDKNKQVGVYYCKQINEE